MPVRPPLLGWSEFLGPTAKAARHGCPPNPHKTPGGFYFGIVTGTPCHLPGGPPLPHIIGILLEGKQVSPQNIKNYLTTLGDLRQYDRAFKFLWHMACQENLDLAKATPEQIACLLVRMNSTLPCTLARNAYSALTMLPGYEGIKFSPLLKRCKREWASSIPKYAAFWDAGDVLTKLAHQKN